MLALLAGVGRQSTLTSRPGPGKLPLGGEAIEGHLCRCTGYVKQVKAIMRAAERMAGARSTEEQR